MTRTIPNSLRRGLRNSSVNKQVSVSTTPLTEPGLVTKGSKAAKRQNAVEQGVPIDQGHQVVMADKVAPDADHEEVSASIPFCCACVCRTLHQPPSLLSDAAWRSYGDAVA